MSYSLSTQGLALVTCRGISFRTTLSSCSRPQELWQSRFAAASLLSCRLFRPDRGTCAKTRNNLWCLCFAASFDVGWVDVASGLTGIVVRGPLPLHFQHAHAACLIRKRGAISKNGGIHIRNVLYTLDVPPFDSVLPRRHFPKHPLCPFSPVAKRGSMTHVREYKVHILELLVTLFLDQRCPVWDNKNDRYDPPSLLSSRAA